LFDEVGADVPWVTRMNDETIINVRERLAEDAVASALEEGGGLTREDATGLALRACIAAAGAAR
jgi:hypothetical protein